MANEKFCSKCQEYVEPEYETKMCIAPYGSIVTAKGYCPYCYQIIVREHVVDDDGLHPPKRG